MTRLFRFLLFTALVFESVIAFTQTSSVETDLVYGNDPLLYNGSVYTFFPPPGTGGTQYLNDKFDTKGSVTIRGNTYSGISLNYDVYNQQLVLSYKNTIGSPCQIEISEAWLEKFTVGGTHFEIKSGTNVDSAQRIYQILGNGTDKIMYYRFKELLIDTRTASKAHFFSDIIREMYVKTDSRMVKYKNNRSFIAVFDEGQQDQIKKYMHKNKIKVKKANDQIMTELINFCNTLSGS